jgi:hypothetical protein
LNVKDNSIGNDGKMALAKAMHQSNVQFLVCDEWSLLKGNIKLDVSARRLGHYQQPTKQNKSKETSDATLLGAIIQNNGALSTLIFGGEKYAKDGVWDIRTPAPATLEVGMTEANFSNKNLGAGGAIIISAWITNKDNGAMTSLNLASNMLRVEGAKIIAAVLPTCT